MGLWFRRDKTFARDTVEITIIWYRKRVLALLAQLVRAVRSPR